MAFYMPSYSPELNPDERMISKLKQGIASRSLVRNNVKLKEYATYHMQMLNQFIHWVMEYFKSRMSLMQSDATCYVPVQ